MSGPELTPGTLQFAVFETVRKLGGHAADGQTMTHAGQDYRLTVDLVCDLTAYLVTIQHLNSPDSAHQTSMAIADLLTNDCADVRGLGIAMETLVTGVDVKPARPPNRGVGTVYRVIPFMPVPMCYAKTDSEADQDGTD